MNTLKSIKLKIANNKNTLLFVKRKSQVLILKMLCILDFKIQTIFIIYYNELTHLK